MRRRRMVRFEIGLQKSSEAPVQLPHLSGGFVFMWVVKTERQDLRQRTYAHCGHVPSEDPRANSQHRPGANL